MDTLPSFEGLERSSSFTVTNKLPAFKGFSSEKNFLESAFTQCRNDPRATLTQTVNKLNSTPQRNNNNKLIEPIQSSPIRISSILEDPASSGDLSLYTFGRVSRPSSGASTPSIRSGRSSAASSPPSSPRRLSISDIDPATLFRSLTTKSATSSCYNSDSSAQASRSTSAASSRAISRTVSLESLIPALKPSKPIVIQFPPPPKPDQPDYHFSASELLARLALISPELAHSLKSQPPMSSSRHSHKKIKRRTQKQNLEVISEDINVQKKRKKKFTKLWTFRVM